MERFGQYGQGVPHPKLVELVEAYNEFMATNNEPARAKIVSDGLLVKVGSSLHTPMEFEQIVGNL